MKKFLVNNTVQKGLLQSDMAQTADNVLEAVSSFLSTNSTFLILSGLEWQDNAYTAGVVVMDGIVRSVPAGATTTSYLAPYDEPTDSRLTQNGTHEATYINYTTTISSEPTGYPQLTWDNVKTFRGWINPRMFAGGYVFRWYYPVFGQLQVQKTSTGYKITFNESQSWFTSISQSFDSGSNALSITFSGAPSFISPGGIFVFPSIHMFYGGNPAPFTGGIWTTNGYPSNNGITINIDMTTARLNDIIQFNVLLMASPYGEVPSVQLQSNG